jgi:hypothetical protein
MASIVAETGKASAQILLSQKLSFPVAWMPSSTAISKTPYNLHVTAV